MIMCSIPRSSKIEEGAWQAPIHSDFGNGQKGGKQMGSDTGYILEMNHITKEFPGVKALKDVTFKVRKGVVHGLMGENGAGKSTLMKILQGIYTPHRGQ